MRKYFYFVILCCVYTSACNQDKIQRLEAQNRDLAAKLASANLDLQDKCSKRARIEFVDLWQKRPLGTFTNHYNIKLNKCFVLFNEMQFDGGTIISSGRVLMDAFEGKELAHRFWRSEKGEKAGKITRCDVIALDGTDKACHSTDEFEQMIKSYMRE